MKESQARTKVVLRHLPPSISQAALLEHVDSKFAGCYSWFSFRPGKASVQRQVLSRAYINFKKAEDVFDFCEDFDGHVFVNEKGTQFKVIVEYAPYQRIPKPRSKKDIREGTISKDSDYIEFLEMLGKPIEYLPSAEVQLERREAEKAAALGSGGGKETVVITPLMEFVRQRRAAKAGTQRSIASKLGARSGGVTVANSNLTSHKRGLERSRSGPLMFISENATSSLSIQKDFKEVSTREPMTGQRREEHHLRRDREVVIEKRKREISEGKDKKPVHETVSIVSSSKGNGTSQVEARKEETVVAKDFLDRAAVTDSKADVADVVEELSGSLVHSVVGKAGSVNSGFSEGGVGDLSKDFGKREVVKRKQSMQVKDKQHKDMEVGLPSAGQVSVGNSNSYNQRHRPPVSPRFVATSAQSQLATSFHAAASGEVSSGVTLSKPNHRRDFLGKNSSKGPMSPRDQQSSSHILSNIVLLDQSRSQQGSPQSDRAGKRPPRPQSTRPIGKEPTSGEAEVGSLSSSSSSTPFIAEEKITSAAVAESFSGPERQDSRRVRNKDRPDRPVWTPRRRSGASQSLEPSPVPTVASTTTAVSPHVTDPSDVVVKIEKSDRGQKRSVGKSGQILGQNWVESSSLGILTDGGRSQPGSGSNVSSNSVSGKARYVESSNRSTRGVRAVSGNAVSTQEHHIQQGERRSDNFLPATVDTKISSHPTVNNLRENGENHNSVGNDKEKHKQDSAPIWSELTGGSHRRRERNVQHGSRDGDGTGSVAETSKPTKRGGNLASGGNEKQVWVAVQKAASGT